MRSLTLITICAFVLAFSAVPAMGLLGLPETLEGVVENTGETTLAVLSEKGDVQEIVEIQINEETEFEEAASLNNLQKGDRVKVTYKEKDEAKIAISVVKVEASRKSKALEML